MFRLLLTFCAHARTREISKKEDDGLKKKETERKKRTRKKFERERKKKEEGKERKEIGLQKGGRSDKEPSE